MSNLNPVGRDHKGERCKACKAAIANLLRSIFGEVVPNADMQWSAHPDHHWDVDPEGFLPQLHELLLGDYKRAVGEPDISVLVRRMKLARCDYFVPSVGLLVELDERQHFTIPRQISLDHYSKAGAKVHLGFDRKRWTGLCATISAVDRDPPFRDWQRAWLDSVRDIRASWSENLRPIVRLRARDAVWCSLSTNCAADKERFCQALGFME